MVIRPIRAALLLLVVALALPLATATTTTAPAYAVPAVDVTPDDGRDLYIGAGGLVVPSRAWLGDAASRRQAAECDGCMWRITSYCPRLEYDTGGCTGSRDGCPSGMIRVRVWQRQDPGPWIYLGPACQGGDPPVSRLTLGLAVREQAEQALPALRAGVQPPDGVLVGLPAVFRTGQPATGLVAADLSVLGFAVTLDARPRWQWVWGDGTSTWTSRAGGVYPDRSVSHTYWSLTAARATVTAVWRGTYVVDGLGPYPVPGAPLTQQSTLAVTVREARAVLVR